MGLLQVVVNTAASKLEYQPHSETATANPPYLPINEAPGDVQKDPPISEPDSKQEDNHAGSESSASDEKRSIDISSIFLRLPQSDLSNLCSILGHEGYY